MPRAVLKLMVNGLVRQTDSGKEAQQKAEKHSRKSGSRILENPRQGVNILHLSRIYHGQL